MINEKPIRKTFSGIQKWRGNRECTFKQLCPVEELVWTPGWEVESVYSNSGVAEDDCIFLTPNADGQQSNFCLITEHRPQDFVVEMYKISPEGVVMKLNIELLDETNGITTARLTMTRTAYTDKGKAQVEAFNDNSFSEYMEEWETSLNYYLDNGKMISN